MLNEKQYKELLIKVTELDNRFWKENWKLILSLTARSININPSKPILPKETGG